MPNYTLSHDDGVPVVWSVFRLEYKYSRLVMSANKDCELPAADSCALAEGEEQDDDVVYTQKPSLLGKLRAIANKVCVSTCFKLYLGRRLTSLYVFTSLQADLNRRFSCNLIIIL